MGLCNSNGQTVLNATYSVNLPETKELLEKFKEQSKKIRPAVVQLMAEVDEIAKSGKATSLDELFGTEA